MMKKILSLMIMLCFAAPAAAQEWEDLSYSEQVGRIMAITELCKRHALMYFGDPRVAKIKEAFKYDQTFQNEFQDSLRQIEGDMLSSQGRNICRKMDDVLDEVEEGQ